jgi:hypothetical protein
MNMKKEKEIADFLLTEKEKSPVTFYFRLSASLL